MPPRRAVNQNPYLHHAASNVAPTYYNPATRGGPFSGEAVGAYYGQQYAPNIYYNSLQYEEYLLTQQWQAGYNQPLAQQTYPPPPPPSPPPPPEPENAGNEVQTFFDNVGIRGPKPKKQGRRNKKQGQQQQPELQEQPLAEFDTYDPRVTQTFRSTEEPILQVLERPKPTQRYLEHAQQKPSSISKPRPLLVVLDLNGTLLYRKGKYRSNFVQRPNVKAFLHYLLENHKVMVWSSARAKNVEKMVKHLFTEEQRKKIVAVWGRDKLRLPKDAYNMKVQVYKQLSWVWSEKEIQDQHPTEFDYWRQDNTVLIDDSKEKGASEPYNVIEVDEFEGTEEQTERDVLGLAVEYLKILSKETNVSAFMHAFSFRDQLKQVYDMGPLERRRSFSEV